MESNAQICGVTFTNPKTFNLPDFLIGSKKASIMTYTYNPDFNSNDYSSWLLSGNGGNIFLSVKKQLLREKIRIRLYIYSELNNLASSDRLLSYHLDITPFQKVFFCF